MLDALAEIESSGLSALAQATDGDALEKWRIEYLGAKGRVRAAMAGLKDVPKDQKPAVGKRLNEVKAALEAAFETKAQALAGGNKEQRQSQVDVTEPGIPMGLGRRHVLTRTIDEITDVFTRMGFAVAEGPELEDEWHNFTALNIPAEHVARDPIENFYLRKDGEAQALQGARGGEGATASMMLRSQTSTIQIRTMEKQKPPLKVIAVGRVYRPDTHDATHFSMFHQIEGLCVDRNVTLVDLKTALFQFARAYFGEQAEVRMRPSFFPFTEPSAEVDMKMQVKGQWQWVELGGCGMVDPNVFQAVGYDPEEWTGFAFGLGIERIAMRKYGIADIRWLYENDARFLRQF